MISSRLRVGAALACLCAAALITAEAMAAKPTTPELTPIEQLGKELFFDKISQPARSMSCAFCHDPKAGWVGVVAGVNQHGAVYRGAQPQRFGNRKPPSSAYASFSPEFHYDVLEEKFFGGNFWDGRATGWRLGSPTAEQALGPYLNPVEQNMPDKQSVCRHVAKSKYAGLFEQVWGSGSLDCSVAGIELTYDRFGLSMGAFQASAEVSPFSSKFDHYWSVCLDRGNTEEACGLAEGEKQILDPEGILSDQEFDGLIEFGEYCSACHVSHIAGPGEVPPLFTNNGFENIGVPKNPDNPFYMMDEVYLDDGSPINPEGAYWIDLGLGGFLRNTAEFPDLAYENDGKFRVPTVRNVDVRPGRGVAKAYMHNGALRSLEEVVRFYNTRDVLPRCGPEDRRRDWGVTCWPEPEVERNLNIEEFEGLLIGDFQLDAEAEAAIVAFMKTLSDGYKR